MTKMILEAAHFNESIDFTDKSIEELKRENPRVIRFKAVLQTLGVKNRNGRLYPRHVLEQAINDPRIQDIIKRNALSIEVGHPFSLEIRRQQYVDDRNTCAIIKKMWVEDDKVVGIIETTADPIGTAFKDRILYNGLIPAFSLRATGDFRWDSKLQANVIVPPLTMFSYDLVQYPSHNGAIMEKLTESVDLNNADVIENGFTKIIETSRNNMYNTPEVFNEGMIFEIPTEHVEQLINPKKPLFNLTESYGKNVKKTHEFYAYNPNDKVVFNEDLTVTIEKPDVVKIVPYQDYIKKDISYNIYEFLNDEK